MSEEKMPERKMDDSPELAQPIDSAIKRLLEEAVDDALATIRAEGGGSELVRRGIGEMLKDALLAAVESRRETTMAAGGNGGGAVATRGGGGFGMGEATGVAIGAAKAVQDLGFVEFTAGLINGTFDAITGSTLKQMDAYSKMVADIAKSLKEFEAEKVSPGQIDAWLMTNYPEPDKEKPGMTVVRADKVFADIKDGETVVTAGTDLYKEVCEALVRDLRTVAGFEPPLTFEDLYVENATPPDAGFTATRVSLIREKVGLLLAKTSQDALIAMARMGMARIVVTQGEILSKLTFRVSSSEIDNKISHHYDSESKRWGAGGSISLPLKFLSISGGGGYSSNKFNCNTVNETTFDSTTMSAEIIGQVKIGFKTESFAPAEPPAVPA